MLYSQIYAFSAQSVCSMHWSVSPADFLTLEMSQCRYAEVKWSQVTQFFREKFHLARNRANQRFTTAKRHHEHLFKMAAIYANELMTSLWNDYMLRVFDFHQGPTQNRTRISNRKMRQFGNCSERLVATPPVLKGEFLPVEIVNSWKGELHYHRTVYSMKTSLKSADRQSSPSWIAIFTSVAAAATIDFWVWLMASFLGRIPCGVQRSVSGLRRRRSGASVANSTFLWSPVHVRINRILADVTCFSSRYHHM